jgi:cytochrome c-type biogenesis protein CcmH/NrfG
MAHSTSASGERGPEAPPHTPLALPLLLRCAVLAGLLLAHAGALWSLTRQPGARYLAAHGPAEWIVYPAAVQPWTVRAAEQETVFRRSFPVEIPPPQATLSVRASRAVAVTLNGREVPLPDDGAGADWKKPLVLDAAPYLRAGDNRLTCTVRNDNGPPALWLTLEVGPRPLLSDASWESSLLGATWLPARSAAAAPELRPGSPAAGGERTAAGLRAQWGFLLGFAALSALVLAAWRYAPPRVSRLWLGAAGITVGWVGLLASNWPSLPFLLGYDAELHLEYVRYVRDRGALPLGNERPEMHQPPLYYVLAAEALRMFGAAADGGERCVLLLRTLGLLTGLAGVLLAALCLRRLFPGRAPPQAAGVVIAAALPPYLYLAHYVSNDLLAGVLGTAAVYLTLVALQADKPKAGLLVALGACLGAAVLAKLTAVPVVVTTLAVLALTAAVRGRSALAVARSAGVPLLVCLLVCGWFFYRNYRHFGRPVVGAYDPASGFLWWQHPGYADAAQFLRFGRGLTDPFYAALVGVPDGLYSTLWGDGGWGGALGAARPPWNYERMAAGYALALLPTALALLGWVAAAVAWVRRPTAEWGLLLALPVAAGAALAYHYLGYPFFLHVKAFYLLPAAVAGCAFAGYGFDLLTRRSAWARGGLGVLLGAWALTAFSAFLVRPSADTLAWVGTNRLNRGERPAAVQCAMKALEADRASPAARALLGRLSLLDRRPADAAEQFLRAAGASPWPEASVGLAHALALLGRTDEAVRLAEDTVRRYPDSAEAHRLLATLRDFESSPAGTVQAAREGLRVSPADARLHVLLARGLLRSNETAQAVRHYRVALRFDPKSAAALAGLAWVLAVHEESSFRNGPEAVALAQQACELTDSPAPPSLRALAAAYAEAGDFAKAQQVAQGLLDQLAPSGNAQLMEQVKRDVGQYRAGRPLRAKPQSMLEDARPGK